MEMKTEALKLAEQLEDDAKYGECDWTNPKVSADLIRRLVEELDKKQQGLVDASAMLVNYKCELDLERTMSAQLKEELEKQK